jgi:hypothetical protein
MKKNESNKPIRSTAPPESRRALVEAVHGAPWSEHLLAFLGSDPPWHDDLVETGDVDLAAADWIDRARQSVEQLADAGPDMAAMIAAAENVVWCVRRALVASALGQTALASSRSPALTGGSGGRSDD